MAKLNPDSFTQILQEKLKESLLSVILYGSAAAGDHLGRSSDYNILVVTSRLGVTELKALAEASKRWMRDGNPPPLVFTRQRLMQAADVFPIELLDMQQSRRVLHGEDIVATISVSRMHLRHQLEHELRSKMIKLREGYIALAGKESSVIGMLMDSLSPFQALIKATLRLMQLEVPPAKRAATEALSRHIQFDPEPFLTLEKLKSGELAPRAVRADDLFQSYLTQLESIVDAVDGLVVSEV